MTTDHVLVDRMRAGLQSREWLRVHAALLILVSAVAAFLVSVSLLALGLHSMGLRYAAAGVGGYAAFLLLLRGWARWKRAHVTGPDLDLSVLGDLDVSWPGGRTGSGDSPSGEGRSGGAGASMIWGEPPASHGSRSGNKNSGVSLDLDADDLFWVIVAIAAALAGLTAVAYVIYIAPALFAEAAVNAAVASQIYRGVTRRDPHRWTADALRHTAVPALILIASLAAGGYALQRAAPEARSIGGVIAHYRN